MKSKLIALCTFSAALVLGGCSGKISGDTPGDPSASGSGKGNPSSGTSSGVGPPDPSATSEKPPTAGQTEPGDSCFTADIGMKCDDPSGKAKGAAVSLCEAKGARIVDLSSDPAGRCLVSCCFASGGPGNPGQPVPPGKPPSSDPGKPPAPDPGKPPPPAPTSQPGSVCNYIGLGDGIECIAHGAIGTRADSLCRGFASDLRAIYLGATCPGGVLFAKVECCVDPAPPVPPPPGVP